MHLEQHKLQRLENRKQYYEKGERTKRTRRIRAIGIIILGWGMVQVGMSVQSHDASQRTQGFLCLFGGLLITFAKEILGAIGVV